MTKKLIVASLLLSAAAAFCAAQVRVEFRKTGDTLTLYGNGHPIGALVPFKEADFAAADEVV